MEVDYDPGVIGYGDLLRLFFESHTPTYPPHSVQYRSAIFHRTDDELAAVREAIARAEVTAGHVYTAVERFTAFHLAEDYHQKYTLRRYGDLMGELRRMFPRERDFVDSTTTARLNGWLSGCGKAEQLERELPLTGLSEKARGSVLAAAMPGGRARIGCGA